MSTGFGGYALGAFLLLLGSDSLLKGATGLALNAGMLPARIGVVVVGFGSGLAALAVSLAATLAGHPEVALGNVVGSNVAFIGLVLGVAALVRALDVKFALAHWLLPLLIGAGALLFALGYDLSFGRIDAIVLLGAFALVLALVWWRAARETEPVQRAFAEGVDTARDPGRSALRIAIGIAALVGGAMLVARATGALAASWTFAPVTAGLSLAAIASALPVLATAALFAWRGHGDLALAAALGAGLVNSTLALGICALAGSLAPAALAINAPAMLVFALALYPMLRSDACLTSSEGGTLVAAFGVYMAWQLFLATPA